MSTFWSLAPVLATAMLFVVCIILWFVHRQRKNFKAWTEGAANWRSTAHAWGLAVQARAAGEAPALPAGPALPSEPPAFPAPSAGASGQVPLALIITALTGLVTAGGKIYLDSQTKQLSVRTAEVDSLRKQLQEWKSAEVELFHYELTDWSRLRQHAAEAPGPGRRIDGGLLDGGCGGTPMAGTTQRFMAAPRPR